MTLNKMQAFNAYKETKIKTAGGGRLIVMLYDEAIRQITIASEALERRTKQLDIVNNAILKAQDIITELMASLDFERGGDIAKHLFSLYIFFNQKLMEANIKKQMGALLEVKALMSELRNAWAEIAGKAVFDPSKSVSTGVNIAG